VTRDHPQLFAAPIVNLILTRPAFPRGKNLGIFVLKSPVRDFSHRHNSLIFRRLRDEKSGNRAKIYNSLNLHRLTEQKPDAVL